MGTPSAIGSGDDAMTAPTVITTEVTGISRDHAIGGGTITDLGGGILTRYGTCWSKSHDPTTADPHTDNRDIYTPWNNVGPDPNTEYTDVGTLHITTQHGTTENPLVYDGYRFTGNNYVDSAERGVVEISHQTAYAGGCHDIIFRNCYFCTSTLPTGGNGVHIGDSGVLGEAMHDITFDHCYFEYQERMIFECNGRRYAAGHGTGDYPGYYNLNLTNNYFEVSGAESISIDDDNPNHVYNAQDYGNGKINVIGNYVEGSDGSGRSHDPVWAWSYTLEFNRVAHVLCTGNFLGPAPSATLNTRATTGDAHAPNMDWVFSGNTIDMTRVIAGLSYPNLSGGGRLWMCGNVTGGVTVSDTLIGPVPWQNQNYGWGYFIDCANLHFGGSTLHGFASQNPSIEGGYSGFTLPTLV